MSSKRIKKKWIKKLKNKYPNIEATPEFLKQWFAGCQHPPAIKKHT